MNSVSVNICAQDYFAGVGKFQLSRIPRSGVTRSYGNPTCHSGEKLLNCFPKRLQNFTFPSARHVNSHLSTFLLTLVITNHSCCCSIAKSCSTLGDSMNCSRPGSSLLPYLPEFAQIHLHWVSDAIQPSHPLSSPSPPAFNLSQHQGLF